MTNIPQYIPDDDSNYKGLRVLCAEDNLINQRLVKQILGKAGAEVDIAADGEQAIDHLCKWRYDLVLMDIQMPKMNGMEVTRIIRDPASKILDHAIPIIGLTADAFQRADNEAINSGMNFVIQKPLDQVELSKAIARLRTSGANI